MRIFLFKLFVSTCLACFINLRTVSAQNTLYVDAGGNNTANNCLIAGSPCATIAHAITQANPGDVITATGNLTSEIFPLVINKSITLRGSQANTKPVLSATSPFAPIVRGTETQLNFSTYDKHILIEDGVNNVTIEGFEFISGESDDSDGNALIIFESGTLGNDNITIRRNILNANEDKQRRFLLKENIGGNLTNIKILENRLLGLGGFGISSGSSNGIAAIDIRKAGTGNNEIRGNVIGTGTVPNRVQKGIALSNVVNFTVAQNEFRNILASPVEIVSTTAGGNVVIEFNTFINSNATGFAETGAFSPIAAGIVLQANAIGSASFIIRNNDFQGDNKMAIAIPAAFNNFTTNAIRVTENKFSNSNAVGSNASADLYIGNDTDVPTGAIYTDGNWWGHTTSSAPNRILTSVSPNGTVNSDILGGLAAAMNRVRPYTWLNSGSDANGAAPGFVSNKVVTFDGALLQNAFNGIPEGWTFFLPDNSYSGTYSITQSSFNIDSNPNSVTFGNLTVGNSRTVTLNESFGISDGFSGSLTLTGGGKIRLGAHSLYILNSATISGDENSYVITDGVGKLVQTEIGSTKTGDILFPVGPDDLSYTPATINNDAGVSDDFSVSVERGISENGNDNNPVTQYAVDLTWQIEEFSPSGSDVTLTLQWNNDPVLSNFVDEQMGFDPAISYIAHYNTSTSKWENLEVPPGTPATGGSTTGSLKKIASGITSFSPFAIGSPGAALPVRLVDFKAELKNNDVVLSWITASEKNNSHFSIERSEDGSTFYEIGKASGKGTSDIFNTYAFTDMFATEIGRDILYYRLKQVDTDGKFSYSKIQDVVFQNLAIRLFPNPAHHLVYISLPGKALLQVISSQGQIVLQKEFESSTQLNVSGLAKGMYVFKFSNGREVLFKKVNIF